MTWGPSPDEVSGFNASDWNSLEFKAISIGVKLEIAEMEAEHYKAAYHRSQKRALLFSTVALLWAFVRLWWVLF